MSIFISYSHHDKPVAEETIELLELAFPDTKVFWDKRLLGGDVLENQLSQEVRFSQALVFIASNNSMQANSYCQRELHWARTYDIQIVPYCVSAAPEEVAAHLGGDSIFCIDARTRDSKSFAQLCGSVFRAVTPYDESHRRQMYLLYTILSKLDPGSHQDAIDVYEGGYELDYSWTPELRSPMSEKECIEVIDILDMFVRLQDDWNGLSLEEKSLVSSRIDRAEYRITNVGFWANEEGKHLGYLRYLRKHQITALPDFAFGNGNVHGLVNLPRYRRMLQRYNKLQSEEGKLYEFVERALSPEEFVLILREY